MQHCLPHGPLSGSVAIWLHIFLFLSLISEGADRENDSEEDDAYDLREVSSDVEMLPDDFESDDE